MTKKIDNGNKLKTWTPSLQFKKPKSPNVVHLRDVRKNIIMTHAPRGLCNYVVVKMRDNKKTSCVANTHTSVEIQKRDYSTGMFQSRLVRRVRNKKAETNEIIIIGISVDSEEHQQKVKKMSSTRRGVFMRASAILESGQMLRKEGYSPEIVINVNSLLGPEEISPYDTFTLELEKDNNVLLHIQPIAT